MCTELGKKFRLRNSCLQMELALWNKDFFLTLIGKYCLLSKNYSFFTNSANKTLKTHFNNQGGGEGKIKFSSQYIPVNQNINLACLSVCLYPINVKTAEPIGPKFFVGHHVTTGKVFFKSAKFFFLCFKMWTKRTCSQFKKQWARSAL